MNLIQKFSSLRSALRKRLSRNAVESLLPEPLPPEPQLPDPATDFAAREQAYLEQIRVLNESLDQAGQEARRRADEVGVVLRQSLQQHEHTWNTLLDQQAKLHMMLDSAHDAFVSVDGAGLIQEWNRSAEQLLGWNRDEVVGKSMAETILPPQHRQAHHADMSLFLESGKSTMINTRFEITALQRDGSELPVEMSIGHVKQQDGHLFIVYLHDISDRLVNQKKLLELLMTDPLTGMFNRRSFTERLPEAMARAERHGKTMAVLFLDLDNFKRINDDCGHDVGDALLCMAGERIQESIRQTDMVARIAGDELIVILEDLQHGETDALNLAHKIMQEFNEPFDIQEKSLEVSVSIGVALYRPGTLMAAKELVKYADQAMVEAKDAGKNRVVLSRLAAR